MKTVSGVSLISQMAVDRVISGRSAVRSVSTSSGQRGVALIAILLVLAVLSTLAIYSAEDQHIAIRRMENLGQAEQGYQVNLSGEQWVVKVLEKDIDNDRKSSQQQSG